MERRREAYCSSCKMFCHIDDDGCCVECGSKVLEPKEKSKKKKK